MWTRALLKENAKVAFKRNYWICVAVSAILMLIGGSESSTINLNWNTSDSSLLGDSYGNEMAVNFTGEHFIWMSLIGIIGIIAFLFAIAFALFVTNIINIGGKRYFMENREHKTALGQMFYGFQGRHYLNCVKTMFFKELYIFGWTLLFIIPGIIKSFSYQLVPYILAENPNLSKDRAIELSAQMMDGYKMEAFVLRLSFIGWDMLNALTVGILGIFYVNPYKNATHAEFYAAVKADAFNKGITNSIELPGFSNQAYYQEVHQESAQEFYEQPEEDIFAED